MEQLKPPSQPPLRRWLSRIGQTAGFAALALSVAGWQSDSCNKSNTVVNPLNNQTASRLYVTLQPPELRHHVSTVFVEILNKGSNGRPSQFSHGPAAPGPTIFDIDPDGGTAYRLRALDGCQNVLAEVTTPTGASKEKDGWRAPDEINATLTLQPAAIPSCSPSPSPSPSESAASPAPSPTSPLTSPVPSPGPSVSPSQAPAYYGGGGSGTGTPLPSASVTVNLSGRVQRGSHAVSEGAVSNGSPSPWPSVFWSPSPSPWPSPSWSPSPSPS
jgi:hypothetical protein